MTARVSMLLKSRASPDILLFSPSNKKRFAIWHMNRPLFPKTLSIPSYDIGKYVGLRIYQHNLLSFFCSGGTSRESTTIEEAVFCKFELTYLTLFLIPPALTVCRRSINRSPGTASCVTDTFSSPKKPCTT